MEAQWQADRATLRTLLRTQPTWRHQDLADAVGRSLGWVKKWVKRLRMAAPADEAVLCSRSRARKHPPPTISQAVMDRVLEIRSRPPTPLQRVPGPLTIRYYLEQDAELHARGERIPRSTRTIWRILRHDGCSGQPVRLDHVPLERPAPLTAWQLDFKDVSSVPADPEGKQQHVVEVLDTLDTGTSLLLNAQVRDDFTAETALVSVAQTLRQYGLPDRITIDRDPRFVGSAHQRDFPSPFVRFWTCLGVAVTICPPQRPDLNGFVERYHRTYEYECLRPYQPADVTTATTVTNAFRQFYNYERPHQGLACGNQPPRVAFPSLPRRAPLPAVVDPDRWINHYDGRRFVRKVKRDCRVTVDQVSYYITQPLVAKYVPLRVDATRREFVVEHDNREVKRIAIKGLDNSSLLVDEYLQQICAAARTERLYQRPFGDQRRLPL